MKTRSALGVPATSPATLFAGMATVTAALLVGGCISGRSVPPVHYYTLLAPAPPDGEIAAPSEDPGSPRLGVESFDVDPPYDQDRLVYRPSPDSSEVGFYSYHRWAAPLGRLTAAALAERLSGVAGLTAEPWASSRDYAAVLGGRVVRIEEIDSAAGPEVRVALELRLREPRGEVFWSTTLAASAGGTDGLGGAEVMGLVQRAFDRLLAEARPAVAAALEGR